MEHGIVIPFRQDMQALILANKKTATTRTKCYGRAGDWFCVGNNSYILTNVEKVILDYVVTQKYKDEGFETPHDFIHVWEEIHPKGFITDQKVWLHEFKPFKQEASK